MNKKERGLLSNCRTTKGDGNNKQQVGHVEDEDEDISCAHNKPLPYLILALLSFIVHNCEARASWEARDEEG